MTFFDPTNMVHAEPLPGWDGHFFHAANLTIARYVVAPDAEDIHEHHHPEEEVWNIVSGAVLLRVDGEERELHPGEGAVVAPGVRHSVGVLGPAVALIVDHPVRRHLPGSDH